MECVAAALQLHPGWLPVMARVYSFVSSYGPCNQLLYPPMRSRLAGPKRIIPKACYPQPHCCCSDRQVTQDEGQTLTLQAVQRQIVKARILRNQQNHWSHGIRQYRHCHRAPTTLNSLHGFRCPWSFWFQTSEVLPCLIDCMRASSILRIGKQFVLGRYCSAAVGTPITPLVENSAGDKCPSARMAQVSLQVRNSLDLAHARFKGEKYRAQRLCAPIRPLLVYPIAFWLFTVIKHYRRHNNFIRVDIGQVPLH